MYVLHTCWNTAETNVKSQNHLGDKFSRYGGHFTGKRKPTWSLRCAATPLEEHPDPDCHQLSKTEDRGPMLAVTQSPQDTTLPQIGSAAAATLSAQDSIQAGRWQVEGARTRSLDPALDPARQATSVCRRFVRSRNDPASTIHKTSIAGD